MGAINYKNRMLDVPGVVNGRDLRNLFKVGKDRTLYSTDEKGKSRVINDNEQISTNGRTLEVGDLPYSEKG
ncbi:MAG: hypothetical protein EOM23_00350 [Candidatus Moranbacteria bacterium]|nr:hypothetical protein [Candidatus Moranbacteria bacterium]